MVNYRHARFRGATYFFTVTLRDRRSDVLAVHFDVLRNVIRDVRCQRPFTIEAIAMLPDHIHALCMDLARR